LLAPDPTVVQTEALHAFVDPTTDARALRHLLAATGGFTIDHDSGRPLQSGIAVCADPALAWHFPLEDWDDELVAGWISKQRSRLDQGDVHIGGWLDGGAGSMWLELVWVLPERLRSAAIAIGRMHGQRAVFDLRRRKLVALDERSHAGGVT
jgi:hypothetical protein